MITLTDQNFKVEIEKSNIPVLVDFWAPWCGPCKMIAPVLEELSREIEGKAAIGKLNVDENPQSAGNFGVTGIPTLILFKEGKETNRFVGFADKLRLISFLNSSGIALK